MKIFWRMQPDRLMAAVDFLENEARQNDGCCSLFVEMKTMKTVQPNRMMTCQELEK
jgi:hypothetical protein